MFSMLSGRLPRPADADADPAAAVSAALRLQVEAGLDLVTDGGVRWADPWATVEAALAGGDTGADGLVVRAWRETAALAVAAGVAGPAAVAAVLPGPYALAVAGGDGARARLLGEALGGELAALGAAGCAIAVVEEPAAVAIGEDGDARAAFVAAHRALLGDAPPLHAMLSIIGGSAWSAGAATILAAPYRSYLLDLVAGPDNWYLARAVPGDRGIVCAALRAPSREDQAPLLVWAGNYAASIDGRGLERVGLANASPLDGLEEAEATSALAALARAARLAALPPDEAIAAGLDRRTFAQPAGRGARRGGLPRA